MRRKWIIEDNGERGLYEYLPITEYIVNAKGVCGDRLTFKNTRILAAGIVDGVNGGEDPLEISKSFRDRVSVEGIYETIELSKLGKLK